MLLLENKYCSVVVKAGLETVHILTGGASECFDGSSGRFVWYSISFASSDVLHCLFKTQTDLSKVKELKAARWKSVFGWFKKVLLCPLVSFIRTHLLLLYTSKPCFWCNYKWIWTQRHALVWSRVVKDQCRRGQFFVQITVQIIWSFTACLPFKVSLVVIL